MSTAIDIQRQQLTKLDGELRKREIQLSAALPPGVQFERFLQQLRLALAKNPKLLRCTFGSVFTAVSEALLYGLEIGTHRKLAYLVPYGNNAQLIPSYRGLMELVRRTGQLEGYDLDTVHEGDEFAMVKGDTPRIHHIPSTDADRHTRTITHVYVIFHLSGGRTVRNVWTAAQVDDHKRKFAQGFEDHKGNPIPDSPWVKSWREMAFKTVIRDTVGRDRLPLSDADAMLINRDVGSIAGTVVSTETAADAIEGINLCFQSAWSDEAKQQPQQKQLDPPTEEETDNPVIFQGVPDENFVATLELAVSLGAVSALEEAAIQQCKEPDEIAYVRDVCRKRRDAIAAARSEVKS